MSYDFYYYIWVFYQCQMISIQNINIRSITISVKLDLSTILFLSVLIYLMVDYSVSSAYAKSQCFGTTIVYYIHMCIYVSRAISSSQNCNISCSLLITLVLTIIVLMLIYMYSHPPSPQLMFNYIP